MVFRTRTIFYHFQRRSHLRPKTKFLSAALYVEEARHGTGLLTDLGRDSLLDIAAEDRKAWVYTVYTTSVVQYFLWAVTLLNFSLMLVERPSAVFTLKHESIISLLEVFCLLVYMAELALLGWCLGVRICLARWRIVLQASAVVFGTIAFLLYSILDSNQFWFHYLSIVRVVYLVWRSERVRLTITDWLAMIPGVLDVLALLALWIICFGCAGYIFFHKTSHVCNPRFEGLYSSLMNLFILITTANFPDVMVQEIYDVGAGAALFFVIFIVFGLYFLMNLSFAVVYSSFKEQLSHRVDSRLAAQKLLTDQAFKLLSEETTDGTRVVKRAAFTGMYDALRPRDRVEIADMLFYALGRGKPLSRRQFFKIPDILTIQIKYVHQLQLREGDLSKKITAFIKSKIFNITVNTILVVSTVVTVITIPTRETMAAIVTEWFITIVFMLEVWLKVYAYGVVDYLTNPFNLFDWVIVQLNFILGIVYTVRETDILVDCPGIPMELMCSSYPECIWIPLSSVPCQQKCGTMPLLQAVVIVLRLLRLPRLIASIQRFKVIVATLLNLLPSAASLAGLLFSLCYLFAVIGMGTFGKRMKAVQDNPTKEWEHSAFKAARYDYNDMSNAAVSFLMLFELIVVNNWQFLMNGYEIAMHSKAVAIYFVLFHIIMVVMCMNLLVAFVLEAFYVQDSVQKEGVSSEMEQKIMEYYNNYLSVNLEPWHQSTQDVQEMEDRAANRTPRKGNGEPPAIRVLASLRGAHVGSAPVAPVLTQLKVRRKWGEWDLLYYMFKEHVADWIAKHFDPDAPDDSGYEKSRGFSLYRTPSGDRNNDNQVPLLFPLRGRTLTFGEGRHGRHTLGPLKASDMLTPVKNLLTSLESSTVLEPGIYKSSTPLPVFGDFPVDPLEEEAETMLHDITHHKKTDATQDEERTQPTTEPTTPQNEEEPVVEPTPPMRPRRATAMAVGDAGYYEQHDCQ